MWKKINSIYPQVHYDKERNIQIMERSPSISSASGSVKNNETKNEEE